MKITMVGNFGLWSKGTMGVRALPMAAALVDRGHQVCIVIPPWDAPEESGREYTIDGVRIANVKLPPMIPLLWHALLTVAVIARTLREPSDVVHVFKPKAYAGFAGLFLWLLKRLELSRVRLVVDTDDWEGYGGWNDLERLPGFIKWVVAWHERAGLRCSDAVTVASRALELITWSLGVPRGLVHYVPNGARAQENKQGTSQASLSLTDRMDMSGHPTVLLYTRFLEFRLEKLMDLLCAILEREPLARFLMVGKGLKGEENLLLAMLEKAGLSEKVVFAGWVDKSEVEDWLRLADVAVYPMDDNLLNRSKCPMKLVDLMVNGVPVVAERVGQVAEYVENGVAGILVEPDDVPGFARAVVELLADEAARTRIGEGARKRIFERFGWRRLVGTVEAAYGLSVDEAQKENLLATLPSHRSDRPA